MALTMSMWLALLVGPLMLTLGARMVLGPLMPALRERIVPLRGMGTEAWYTTLFFPLTTSATLTTTQNNFKPKHLLCQL